MTNDLTLCEALNDPLIGLMLRADGIAVSDFAQTLKTAHRVRLGQRVALMQQQRADEFYRRLEAPASAS